MQKLIYVPFNMLSDHTNNLI